MADQAHLSEFLGQETGVFDQVLLRAFEAMVRDPAINPQDYPAHLRQVMDGLLKELVNAPAKPDGP